MAILPLLPYPLRGLSSSRQTNARLDELAARAMAVPCADGRVAAGQSSGTSSQRGQWWSHARLGGRSGRWRSHVRLGGPATGVGSSGSSPRRLRTGRAEVELTAWLPDLAWGLPPARGGEARRARGSCTMERPLQLWGCSRSGFLLAGGRRSCSGGQHAVVKIQCRTGPRFNHARPRFNHGRPRFSRLGLDLGVQDLDSIARKGRRRMAH